MNQLVRETKPGVRVNRTLIGITCDLASAHTEPLISTTTYWLASDVFFDENKADQEHERGDDASIDGRRAPRQLVAAQRCAKEEQSDGRDQRQSAKHVNALQLCHNVARAGWNVDLPENDARMEDTQRDSATGKFERRYVCGILERTGSGTPISSR